MTAGAGAIATKAVAGLAAAAIVTAGAVAVDPGATSRRAGHTHYAAAPATTHVANTIVVHQHAQPSSPGGPQHRALMALRSARARARRRCRCRSGDQGPHPDPGGEHRAALPGARSGSRARQRRKPPR